ncbi:Sec-independent protein translocase subunit TatA/TatB [Flavobacterium aciduliphilum]|uniref:Sec-independent protein translocase protein TatA n=1 Tax=Flavobacterium aciduliphilum TaxID=1101402 RepID=A0A328YE17_9FLAO|nr:twin-arginine translocase TatA/TatE family subunit [Flavobacterium aciduliphilum]RAR71454.1 sec-independent protein translocase protein TatA [Flavobacterium aciduliphilum]
MFGGEFFFIILIAFLLFGTKNLPEVVRGYAKFMATLKNATNEIKSEIQKSADIDGINSSIQQITSSVTQEVEKVKESVATDTGAIGQQVLKQTTEEVGAIQQNIEDIVEGPIKRQK